MAGGLNLYNKKQKAFTHYRHDQFNLKSLSDDRVNCIYEDKHGKLWIGTEKGLNLFEQNSKTFSQYKLGDEPPGKDYVIKEIQEDKEGNLWIATSDNGLYLFNPLSKNFKAFRHIEKDPNSLASNLVRSLLFDKKGNLWVGSINGGP